MAEYFQKRFGLSTKQNKSKLSALLKKLNKPKTTGKIYAEKAKIRMAENEAIKKARVAAEEQFRKEHRIGKKYTKSAEERAMAMLEAFKKGR